MQKYTLQKNPLKEIRILQDIIDSITNLKFPTQAKISSFFTKSSYKKIDLLFIT